jgi:chemotaxis protein methyltransferase CheR
MRSSAAKHVVWQDTVSEPSDAEFRKFRDVIEREAGIHLSASKRALLHGRLVKRIRDLGMRTFTEYHDRVERDEAGELQKMLDCIVTNETSFFREPAHFAYLERTILPAWLAAAPRTIRVWSAGCATGEEPFSIAMALAHALPKTFSIEIIATDISTRVLDAARNATWNIERAEQIPKPLLKRFMLHGIGEQTGKLRASRELRELVRFERLNLNGDAYASGPFDLVFCRNVLIYFAPPRKQAVVGRLAERLAPGGHLFLGHAESVHGFADRLRCVQPTIYERVGGER